MAHDLTIGADGQAEMFYTGKRPWHGLGTQVTGLLNSEEAIKAAKLDWEVGTGLAYYKHDKTGEFMPVDNKRVIYRKDNGNLVGFAGPDWTPLQNRHAFSFCDALVQDKGAFYETAGSLGGGKKVWLLVRLDGVMRVKGSKDDLLETFLLLHNSHEGGVAITVKVTTVRVVCQNTVSQALSEKGQRYFRISHRPDVGMKVAEAREALQLVNKQLEDLNEKMNLLASKQVTKAQFADFSKILGWQPEGTDRQKESYNELVRAFETSPGSQLASAKGTLWGAVNAVTFLTDHAYPQATKTQSAEDRQLKALWFGSGDALKTQALEAAVAMAKTI